MSNPTQFLIADIVMNTVQPLTYTHHGVTDLPMMVRGVDAEGRPQRSVYLPAGQLRGRIRHEAALSVMRAKGEKVQLKEAYMLALGQDLRPEEDSAPEEVRLGEQLKLRAADPFLDLFGTWKLSSRLFVSHLLPAQNVQPDSVHFIRRDLDTNEEIMAELGESEQDLLYERQAKQGAASKIGTQIDLAEKAFKKAKREKNQAEADKLEAALAELKERKKAEKGGDESENTKHLVEVEVIPAGIALVGKITIQNPKASDLNFLIDAFKGISLKPFFGAQRARGCGEINGTVNFRTTDGEGLANIQYGDFKPAVIQLTDKCKAFLESGALTS